jgi:GH15 family glucan-1,4-alpha-glucosidase
VLSRAEIEATVDSIAAVQLPSGMIPWFPGGHCDPWNHVEAAMALAVGGRISEAEAAYRWLADVQHPGGSWFQYYLDGAVENYRLDANVCAYVAAGVWQHYLVTGDHAFLETMGPVVAAATDFVLRLQTPGGEITWCYEGDGRRADFALLTSSSSIYFSMRCALAIARQLGDEPPDWELAAARVGHAVATREAHFEPKRRWAMDWYYPVLSGAVLGDAARFRLKERWDDFVIDGLGVRCVSDRPWTTAAETAECVMALEIIGEADEARRMLEWTRHLRGDDGSYWTGSVRPDELHFPPDERSTYTAAAVVLANDLLYGTGPSAGFFRGDTLPAFGLAGDNFSLRG